MYLSVYRSLSLSFIAIIHIIIIIIIVIHTITITTMAKPSTIIIITTLLIIITITRSNIIFIDTTIRIRSMFTVIPINIPSISITVHTSNIFKSIIKTGDIVIVTNEAVSPTHLPDYLTSSSCTCRLKIPERQRDSPFLFCWLI